MWKLSTPGTRARLLPFSQFTWICPASSTISTLPFKPGGMWLSPSMLLSVTSVPGGYLLRMASILSCVIFLYICTTSFLHLPLPPPSKPAVRYLRHPESAYQWYLPRLPVLRALYPAPALFLARSRLQVVLIRHLLLPDALSWRHSQRYPLRSSVRSDSSLSLFNTGFTSNIEGILSQVGFIKNALF